MNINIVNVVVNELLLSSSSDSDDGVENIGIRGPIVPRPRILHFVENVVDMYSDGEFRENFRMHRRTFDFVLDLIRHDISTPEDASGRHTLNANNQLLIAIWRFSTPDSYRSICSRFNVGKATAFRKIRRVTNALLNRSNQIIKWPINEKIHAITDAFNVFGFPGTIGCIDGSYIKIAEPGENPRSYICRKGFSALILKGICDHEMKFIHTTAGEVGSCHDTRVLRNSEIWEYIIGMPGNNRFPENTYLIGDKAYPLNPYIMTPYRNHGHLTPAQINYNFCLSRARATIERAFCLLKKRFRCLKFLDVKDIVWGTKYILACTVLHNIFIMQNDVFEEDDDIQVPGNLNVMENILRINGRNKRDLLCNELYVN